MWDVWTVNAPRSGTFLIFPFPYSSFHSGSLCPCQPWIIDNRMRSWTLRVWVLCIGLIMISERVTLLKPLSCQHPPLILLNPQNNGLLHAGDCERFLSSCPEGSGCLHTANTTMIAVKNWLMSAKPSHIHTFKVCFKRFENFSFCPVG